MLAAAATCSSCGSDEPGRDDGTDAEPRADARPRDTGTNDASTRDADTRDAAGRPDVDQRDGGAGDSGDPDALVGGDAGDAGSSSMAQRTFAPGEAGDLTLGDFTLRVPAGSIRTTTVLTVEVVTAPNGADTKGVLGLYYDIGPSGGAFDPPLELDLPIASSPTDDPIISWFDEETSLWVNLPTEDLGNGFARAFVSHFTVFTVRDTADAECSFSACGGVLSGRYKIDEVCASVPFPLTPWPEDCPEAVVLTTREYARDGIAQFVSGEPDLFFTYGVNAFTDVEARVPKSCLANLGAEDCAGLPAVAFGGAVLEANDTECSDAGTYCDCASTRRAYVFLTPYGGIATAQGTTLTVQDAANNTEHDLKYCISGVAPSRRITIRAPEFVLKGAEVP